MPAPYAYRCACRGAPPLCPSCSGEAVEAALLREGPDTVAAVIAEPVGGSSTGASVPAPEYWRRVRAVCDRHGVLLVADEVLTGAGRTGTWSALEPYGVVPDIMTLGKGIAGGYVPLSAVVAPAAPGGRAGARARGRCSMPRRSRIMPMLCAAGVATLRYLREHGLIERCAAMGPAFHARLAALREPPARGRRARAAGCWPASSSWPTPRPGRRFPAPPASPRPSPAAALEAGLVVWPNVGQADGINGDLAMLAPPFIVTEDEIDHIVQRFGAALRATAERIGAVAMTAPAKITYTSASGDLDEFHHRFDVALEAVRAAAGARHPFYIGGRAVDHGDEPLVDRSPIDTGLVLGRFAVAGPADVDRAVAAAREAQRGWARLPWRERVAMLRRAAALIRERKYELAALMSLEVGKSRLEAMGDAEESADLIDYYCAPGRGRRRVRAPDGADHAGRAEHRRAAAVRRVRLHRAVQLPARALGRDVVGRARWRATRWCTSRRRTRPGPASGCTRSIATPGLPAGVFNFLVGPPGGDRRRALAASRASTASCSPAPRRSGCGSTQGLSAALDQALPARAGRQERGDRDAERRSRRRGGRGDALGVQPAEPEVQRDLPGLRPPRRWRRRSSSGCSSTPAPCAWATRPSGTSSSDR